MFAQMKAAALSELHFCEHGDLHAIIAIHNTRLGPALGGCRILPYQTEVAAIADAIKLAKGMSYKAALAGVPQGGGKAVIVEPEGQYDREALFRQFGHFINSLGGRYITAMDSGTEVEDMDAIRVISPYVSSGSNIGDPSPATAMGVELGIKVAAQFQLHKDLNQLSVAIQGLGHVGMDLARRLHMAGAKLLVSDIDSNKTDFARQYFNACVVEVDDIFHADVDVLAPCGLGGVLNQHSIPRLQCAIVAGCANNQLVNEAAGEALAEEGILYAPDYVINSGGLIYCSTRYHGGNQASVEKNILRLADTLQHIFNECRQHKVASNIVANVMAERILYGEHPHA